MNAKGFDRFYWGFLFVMFDFRISGFDILPDFIGYLFFAAGFSALAASSIYFEKGRWLNIPMIFLSLFSIYEAPAQNQGQNQLINFGPLGLLAVPIVLVSCILSLFAVYYLFAGIRDMAERRGNTYISEEAGRNWKQYLILQLASLFSIILICAPVLALFYVIVMLFFSVILMIIIMRFMKTCGESL